EEMARFLKDGPTKEELERVQMQYRSSFIYGIERIGGFGGKSDILASNQVFLGRPDFYKVTLERVKGATAEEIAQASRAWLSDGVYILDVVPFPDYKAEPSEVDRSKLPATGTPPDAKFPVMHRATLSNGLKLIVAERHALPILTFDLLVDSGFAADPPSCRRVPRWMTRTSR
ncbi:MAG: insulinase family protein, partial [Candidatus Sumerlaeota bacterium]|nr:insulinase family protein [Candidatus Sumerlaeota bacterium]